MAFWVACSAVPPAPQILLALTIAFPNKKNLCEFMQTSSKNKEVHCAKILEI